MSGGCFVRLAPSECERAATSGVQLADELRIHAQCARRFTGGGRESLDSLFAEENSKPDSLGPSFPGCVLRSRLAAPRDCNRRGPREVTDF